MGELYHAKRSQPGLKYYVQGMLLSDQPTSSVLDSESREAMRERWLGLRRTTVSAQTRLNTIDQVHRLQTTHISQFSRLG